MYKHIKSISLLLLIGLLGISCVKTKETLKLTDNKEKSPQVAVLGMLHFVSKNNTVTQDFTEVTSTKRQNEIKNLIHLLKKYRPTKIAVERPYRTAQKLNKNYTQYLEGAYKLTAEETDQIAFRLGKELNHKQLYLAYHPVAYAFDSTIAYAHQNGQSYIVDSILNNAKELANTYDSIAQSQTITDAILYLNTKQAINKNHFGYQLLSQIGSKSNKIGANTVGDWYTSNLKIYENIRQMAESSNDKILVIYGQGHCKILNQLIYESHDLQLVDINNYLNL